VEVKKGDPMLIVYQRGWMERGSFEKACVLFGHATGRNSTGYTVCVRGPPRLSAVPRQWH